MEYNGFFLTFDHDLLQHVLIYVRACSHVLILVHVMLPAFQSTFTNF